MLNLHEIAKKYNATLYLDEAHSIGVYGDNGAGCAFGKKYEKEIVVGTFGKSFGSFGSFVSTSEDYVKKIINFCGGLIYTTALPPSVYASIHAALKIVPKLNKERKNLLENSKFLRTKLNKLNIDTGNTQSHIIPIILKDEKKCLRIKKKFEKFNSQMNSNSPFEKTSNKKKEKKKQVGEYIDYEEIE